MSELKNTAREAIDKISEDLHRVSQEIWSHPEENYEEHHAHAVITDFLEQLGCSVERHFVKETGFRAVLGDQNSGPHVAVLCEYDALPEIGHACGHNLIAEAGLAAGLGVKAAFDSLDKPIGKLTILGTPAEEGGGGKIDMIDAGVFRDVDVAMMAHPCPYNEQEFWALAIERVTIMYHGRSAHAAAFPETGINALDAAVLCYQNVSAMRQQFKSSWRVHGIIRQGGVKPNIIPDLTELHYYARAPNKAELDELKGKLDRCFQGAAHATGCTVEVEWSGRPFLDLINNKPTSDAFYNNAITVGVDFEKYPPAGKGSSLPTASTDMGNVSYEVASIHPMFYIGSGALNHTAEFTVAAGDPRAQPYTIAVGKALAMTAIDIYTQAGLADKVKAEFERFRGDN